MIDVDAARLPLMLATLHLPTIGRRWQSFAQRADAEGWGAARYLAVLCEHELAERAQRRIARHLRESGLPAGKTFTTFDFSAVPTVRKAHLLALAEADSWIELYPFRSNPTGCDGGGVVSERRHRGSERGDDTMTRDEKIIRNKVGVLELAKQLG